MSDKVIKNVVITSMVKVTDGIYSMWIKDKDLACNAKPGQFVSLYCKEGSQLLPRPISTVSYTHLTLPTKLEV